MMIWWMISCRLLDGLSFFYVTSRIYCLLTFLGYFATARDNRRLEGGIITSTFHLHNNHTSHLMNNTESLTMALKRVRY